MLIWYISKNYFSAESLYAFGVRWAFFNIAAPELDASHWADASTNYGGDFRPELANYFSFPVSAGLVALFGAMLVASVLPKQHKREKPGRHLAGPCGLRAPPKYVFFRIQFQRVPPLQRQHNTGAFGDNRHSVCCVELSPETNLTYGVREPPVSDQWCLHYRGSQAACLLLGERQC